MTKHLYFQMSDECLPIFPKFELYKVLKTQIVSTLDKLPMTSNFKYFSRTTMATPDSLKSDFQSRTKTATGLRVLSHPDTEVHHTVYGFSSPSLSSKGQISSSCEGDSSVSNCILSIQLRCMHSHRNTSNKYFKLKDSWGCRPNSNYLLAYVVLGKSITHVQNTRQLHSVQTH